MLASNPLEHMQVVNEIIGFAKVSLGKKLSKNIYLTLTDHINYAIERYELGMENKNALLWKIKRYYNHEYLNGKEALQIIKIKLGIQLTEDEAGFIALHIVNAQLEPSQVSQVSEMAKIIQKVLSNVKYYFKMDLDEYSLSYERFVTHLKFFVQRLFSGVDLHHDETTSFMFTLKARYHHEYACALKIADYIKGEFNKHLKEDEIIYLTLHLNALQLNNWDCYW